MNIYELIVTYLETKAEVTDEVGTKIYGLLYPQEAEVPGLAIIRRNTDFINDLSQTEPELDNAIVEVSCFASSLGAALDLADIVAPVMISSPSFKASLIDQFEGFEENTTRFRSTLRFSVWRTS